MRNFRSRLVLVACLLLNLLPTQNALAANEMPPLTAGWLETLNWYRNSSGLTSVTEDKALTSAINFHLKYLINTDKALRTGVFASPHTENPAAPLFTREGEAAGKASNIITEAVSDETPAGAIDGWMTAPFHAIGILRENLKTTALAQDVDQSKKTFWGLNVISGLSNTPRSKVILFPGDGATTRVSAFESESPDPREGCPGDYRLYKGLPIFASLLSDPSKQVVAKVLAPNGRELLADDYCVMTKWTYKSTDEVMGPGGANTLDRENMVIIIPRQPLVKGKYTITISDTNKSDLTWSFTSIPAPSGEIFTGIPDQKIPVRRMLTWNFTGRTIEANLVNIRIRLWECPNNRCSTNKLVIEKLLKPDETNFDVSQLPDAFYYLCIQGVNNSGNSNCDYSIIKVQNQCDASVCFVGSTWAGPDSRCWQIASSALLEEKRGSSWVQVAKVPASKGRCALAKYPYSYSAKFQVAKAGNKIFRWRILATGKVLGYTMDPSNVEFRSASGA